MGRRIHSLLSLAVVCFTGTAVVLFCPAFASDAIDLELNPVTGLIEAVAVSPIDGDRIVHVEDSGQGGDSLGTFISGEPAVDTRLAIKSSGESWVVWRDEATAEVRFALRDPVTKVWSPETVLSAPGEDSREPSIAHNESETWVAYEVISGSSRSVAATGIADSPEPFPPSQITDGPEPFPTDQIVDSPEPFPTRTIVATSSSALPLNVIVHAEAGSVWLTWTNGPAELGWSRYDRDAQTWTDPQLQSLAGLTATAAATIVRGLVLAP